MLSSLLLYVDNAPSCLNLGFISSPGSQLWFTGKAGSQHRDHPLWLFCCVWLRWRKPWVSNHINTQQRGRCLVASSLFTAGTKGGFPWLTQCCAMAVVCQQCVSWECSQIPVVSPFPKQGKGSCSDLCIRDSTRNKETRGFCQPLCKQGCSVWEGPT